MWTRAGLKTEVVAMPSATFFPQATELKFSVLQAGWSTGTGEASSSLKALLMTFNREKGFGTANRGRYSNGKVDALTEDALMTVDDVKREAYLQRAIDANGLPSEGSMTDSSAPVAGARKAPPM